MNNGVRVPVERRRAESVGGKGYLRVMLHIDGEQHGTGAHRIVWTHLKGPIPDDLQINHKDLDKTNNRPRNLELATGAENIQHSYANGRTRPYANATQWRGKPILSDDDLTLMRALRARGVILRRIAARFNISVTHAHRVTS